MGLSPRQRELQQAAAREQAAEEAEREQRRAEAGPFWAATIAIAVVCALLGLATGYLYMERFGHSEDYVVPAIFVGLFVGAFGLAFGLIGRVFIMAKLDAQGRRTGQAKAVIVDHSSTTRSSDSGATMRALVLKVDFEVGGQPHMGLVMPSTTFTTGSLDGPKRRYPKGATIDIVYNPDDPSDHGIYSKGWRARFSYFLASAFYGLGVACLALLVVV